MGLIIIGMIFHRVTEFADHLHEHFVDPSKTENGAYKVPMVSSFKFLNHCINYLFSFFTIDNINCMGS